MPTRKFQDHKNNRKKLCHSLQLLVINYYVFVYFIYIIILKIIKGIFTNYINSLLNDK